MRGGTSRGPFFLRSDLPDSIEARDEILLSALGSGHELQIDGIGGGNPLTSKVAIVGPATRADADVDYLFAQVKVTDRVVDTSPNCGNMLSAVGPFAIEHGLVPASDGRTLVRIHNVNTGKIIEAQIATPGGRVIYDGDAHIDGVPGGAAPIHLSFLDVAGAKTGRLLPTGSARDTLAGVEVTCIDAAMPLVLIRAADLGKTGRERPAELDGDRAFMRRLEEIRLAAGAAMGLGDVADRVIPKPVLLGSGEAAGTLAVRYFMPHSCHKALAITGGVGIATACATPGTLAAELLAGVTAPCSLTFEHPSGTLELRLDRRDGEAQARVSVLRTARRIFEGVVYAQVHETEGRIVEAA
jgi:2-methylaconitate cis-trans-isomerase PrpF